MLRRGVATSFLMMHDQFYLAAIVDSQLLLKPHQRETASVGKSYTKIREKFIKPIFQLHLILFILILEVEIA